MKYVLNELSYSLESKLTKKYKVIKSIELDVIIANSDSELEYKKRLFAIERACNP